MTSSRPGEMPGDRGRLLSTRPAVIDIRLHVAELGVQPAAGARAASPHRPDERARRFERQRGDVAAEVAPDAVLIEVLLDVRQVERGHRSALAFDVLAHRTNRLR